MGILKSTNSGLYKPLTPEFLRSRGYRFDVNTALQLGMFIYTSPISSILSVFCVEGKFYTKSIGDGETIYIVEDIKTLVELENYFKCLKTGHNAKVYKKLIEILKPL
jgi:hypothetical protein